MCLRQTTPFLTSAVVDLTSNWLIFSKHLNIFKSYFNYVLNRLNCHPPTLCRWIMGLVREQDVVGELDIHQSLIDLKGCCGVQLGRGSGY